MDESDADLSDPLERAACEELLSYLREHPRAMDSLEGIAEWWLPRQRTRIGTERIMRVLEALTRRGILEQIPDGDRLLYRLRAAGPADEGAGPPIGPG